jgi:hypothetical protein
VQRSALHPAQRGLQDNVCSDVYELVLLPIQPNSDSDCCATSAGVAVDHWNVRICAHAVVCAEHLALDGPSPSQLAVLVI